MLVMKKGILSLICFFLLFSAGVSLIAQTESNSVSDSLVFSGQLSIWSHYNPSNTLSLSAGSRYIPDLRYQLQFQKDRLLEIEGSANVSGFLGIRPFDSVSPDGSLSAYRAHIRFASPQFELRLGLQKISFGSAVMLRPLMWFDQIDPRDPLELTYGVWGALGRYYFLNNANLWVWCLYGNEKSRTWDIGATKTKIPEAGSRIQLPVPKGEIALTYNFRSTSLPDSLGPGLSEIPENRLGLDSRWDLGPGVWFEGSWVHKGKNVGLLSNQEMLNVGTDYTFGIGNGLYAVFEHLLTSSSEKAFDLSKTVNFSALSFQYPLGIVDNLSSMVFYDWSNSSTYTYVNWNHRFAKFTFFVMAYWNPEQYLLPQKENLGQTYAGKGFQLMLVYNH
jgi:hypothetical protein